MNIPLFVVISGPSGVGKRTIVQKILRADSSFSYCVSETTRAPRSEDEEGKTYHFVSEEKFQSYVDAGDFLEHAGYTINRYGTLRSEVFCKPQGKIPLAEIEIEGHRQLRQIHELKGIMVSFYLVPPNLSTLEQRLRGRKDDVLEEEIQRRLHRAEKEMLCAHEFDYVVINEDGKQERATSEILFHLGFHRKFNLCF